MNTVYDVDGNELVALGRVQLVRDIEMERLFAGYDAALAGEPLPRDLERGDEGVILAVEQNPEPLLIVEFNLDGRPFWRGGLRPGEVRAA